MDSDALYQSLLKIKDEVHNLVREELEEIGDQSARSLIARKYSEEVPSLRTQVASTSEEQRPRLENMLRAIDNDLIFLLYSANQTASREAKAQDPINIIRQFSEDVFTLAKAFVNKEVSLTDTQQRVKEFDIRFKELAKLPGHETPECQRLLSEADLELTFIYNGGKGATSLRLDHYIQP